MPENHTLKKYIAKAFDSHFWAVAEKFLTEHMDVFDLEFYRIHCPGEFEIDEVQVDYVWVADSPGMQILFDVLLVVTLEVHEANYRYDNTEEKSVRLMVRCRGGLEQELKDFEIYDVSDYKGKNRAKQAMDSDLVPYIGKDNLETVAEDFLRRHYKRALLEPIWVNPRELAENMGLDVKFVHITEDGSIFGRSYFYECKTELYDPETDSIYKELIPAKTILIDKQAAFLHDLGTMNNTIIHECVHWDKHKKAFALAKIYNKELTNIGCKVVGGIVGDTMEDSAVGWMEWQANALTPKIQMPHDMFKKKAEYLISQIRRNTGEYDMVDIVQPLIDELHTHFGVSRTAAKIRLIELGYDEAMGAYTYIDGRYIAPHKTSKRGFLKQNQTFSISAIDAAIQSLVNPLLQDVMKRGRYIYVDSHFVVNSPLYVEQDELGNTILTHYARNHMEECCLVFDLALTPDKYSSYYHTECYLNRDKVSTVDFTVTFHDGYENSSPEKQNKILADIIEEENQFYSELTTDYAVCLNKAMKWKGVSAAEIARRTGLNEVTVRRSLKGETASVNTLVLICLGLHLPYDISKYIIDNSPTKLMRSNNNHRWYIFALQHLYSKTVDEIKSELAKYGADPL